MKKTAAAGTILFGLYSTGLWGNLLNPLPLDQQREQADTIVIARAARNTTCPVDSYPQACVELRDVVYLKGAPRGANETQYLVTYHRSQEVRFRCCEVGRTYLMFLRGRDEYHRPVAGRWSVLPISRNALPR